MEVIGVIDLAAGRAVHARGGRRDAYLPVAAGGLLDRDGDTVALARAYLSPRVGVRELYVADLDAIGGAPPQRALLAGLAALGAPLWVDAGVRSADGGRALLRASDAARVVVGLETLGGMDDLEEIVAAVGGTDRVAFSLDLRDGVPQAAVADLRGASPAALAAEAAERGAGAVIVLDLARVGSGRGVDVPLLAALRRALPARCALLAGGGVRGRDDLEHIAAAGCDGVLVATALLDGRIGAADVEAARGWGAGWSGSHEA
jgi:phosphoribosylformimino-5-aminoimidazole carboxamide ribotide isomerase